MNTPTDLFGDKGPSRTALIAVAFMVAAAAFLLYLPSLNSGFVNWDDWAYINDNRHIRSLDTAFFKWVATAWVIGNWHPLTIVSFALDYSVWGLDPKGYHLVNIILHSFNTLLVFLLCRNLLKTAGKDEKKALFTGAAAALLFAAHPSHVESVSWVSERKDVLFAFFYLLSVLAYIRYAQGSRLWFILSLVFFLLSLLSKPMAVSLPLVLLILDVYPLRRTSQALWRIIFEKAPFILLSMGSSVLTILAQRSKGAVVPEEAYPLILRFSYALRAYVFYIFKTIAPVNLAPFYPLSIKSDFFILGFIPCLAIFLAVSAASVVLFKRSRALAACWMFFLVTLLPVIGIVQVGSQAAADRYLYVPGIAIFILAGAGLGTVSGRSKALAVLSVAAAVALFSYLTVKQQAYWKDSVALWTREIEIYPDIPLGYGSRGEALMSAGKVKESLPDYDRAIVIRPTADVYFNRGIAYSNLGDDGKAVEDFLSAIRLEPGMADAYHNLALIYAGLGEYELARRAEEKAASLGYR